MTAKKKPFLWLVLSAVLLAALALWAVRSSSPELTRVTVSSPRLPEGFDGYRIAHVSDLHNREFRPDNQPLLDLLLAAGPDMIAVTGDLIDSRRTDAEAALNFLREAAKIAPVYYVSGNHEARIPGYGELKQAMAAEGIVLLEDSSAELRRAGDTMTLIGLNDPSFRTDYLFGDDTAVADAALTELHTDKESFTVLLSHRPELFDTYVKHGLDLVLSGHAHGGQFRLPLLGGLLAPHQGLFPAYDGGLYAEKGTSMIVSRGLGNSLFPFRINNPPELVVIELTTR